jgi:hypothetical protein
MQPGVSLEPRRFYDGGSLPDGDRPGSPPDPGSDPRIVLERHTEDGLERFSLERRLGYLDRHLGELLVPADDGFRTDLTSTPALFTWLVPKTGAHLPAALLHDGLVGGVGGSSYMSTERHVVDRVEADRVFRDAMADTGTRVVRRWIVWAAVTLATIFTGDSRLVRAGHRAAAAGTLALVVWLGWCATGDLFDQDWPLAVSLPWMGDRPWWTELWLGLVFAVLVPAALSLAWGRFRLAGAVAGILLALLLHVTVALALITLGYQVLERLVSLRGAGRREVSAASTSPARRPRSG